MSLRQRIWANKAKADLITAMGGVCWHCGTNENLEIDHIDGRDWSVRKTEFSWRVSRYRKEWLEGKLQLLCEAINKTKPVGMRYTPPPGVTLPFRVEPAIRVHGAGEVPF